jgi:galactose oxidase
MPSYPPSPDRLAGRLGRWRFALLLAALCALLGAATLVSLHQSTPVPAVANFHPPHALPVRLVPASVTTPPPLPRTGWTVSADSQETAAGNYAAANVLDGVADTAWRTASGPRAGAMPHALTVDMHASRQVSGLTYLPPSTDADGRVGRYRVDVGTDGVAWKAAGTGTFADDATLKTVTFATVEARYVRLTALSEAGDRGPRTSAAEINLLAGTDPVLPRAGWTASVDSQDTAGGHPASNVLDGDTATMWQTGSGVGFPHELTVDMHRTNLVSGLSYLGRQDGKADGNVGEFRIETSLDGVNWSAPVATGAFADSSAAQTVGFAPALARYARLTALNEARGRGPSGSAAEINLLGWPDPTSSGDAVAAGRARYTDAVDEQRHTVTVDMHTSQPVGGLTYQPGTGAVTGEPVRYQVDVSNDGGSWKTVASGTLTGDATVKTVTFAPTTVRYVRLTDRTHVGGAGDSRALPRLTVFGPFGGQSKTGGRWTPPIGFPLVPVAAALLPNGKVLTWSSYAPDNFGGSGQTITATYDPATGVVTQRTVTATNHDMFCPGIAILPDGRVLVAGGDDSANTSIYNPATDAWTAGPRMNIPRGYQADVTLSDGRVFTIGGSWSGAVGGKNGEVWSAQQGWQVLPGAPVAPILTQDAQGVYRADNHAWLFAWSGGRVLQAGPSRAMNWFDTTGTGGTTPAGLRGRDGDAMNGDAVMYDAGKILTVGGAPSYQNAQATTNAHVLTITGTNVWVRDVAAMANARSFANSVVLPDGNVVVFGGQNFAVPFSDNTAVLTPELWDSAREVFVPLPPAVVPRTYHSVALLLPDGRVFTGGGGLCGSCSTNHFDAEIFTPPSLLNPDGTPASRPTITAAPATAPNGGTITVSTDRAVTRFSIVRFGAATHTVDTDQRRIGLTPTAVGGGYTVTIPADPGIAVPGYYMLFALDEHGVPSVAKIIRIG